MKISVIIPIYNVEAYLPRCIESVIHQTFKELEILLIDDGSTDESGKIADAYKESDIRIKVIHKENGGLSDARNRGIKESTGEYIFFLDSDDWLDYTALERLYEVMVQDKVDLAVGGFYYAYDQGDWVDQRYWRQGEEKRILNNEEAMTALIENEYVKNFAWGKLYKRQLIEGILFEKGILFEDVFWQVQVFSRINHCTILRQPICYYYQRESSIVGRFNLRKLDILKALYKRHHFINKFYPKLVNKSWYSLLKSCLEYYVILFFHRKSDKKGRCKESIRQFLLIHRKVFETCSYKDKEIHRRFKLFCLHPYFLILYMGMRRIARLLKLRKEEQVLIQVDQD